MATKKKTEKATKIKKKIWCPIIAPKLFKNVFLGETYITEPKLALNKTITKNLMDLTKDVKKQNMNIKFVVDRVEGGKAHTKVVGFKMISSSIKRLTRRRSDKIELSFVCKTSDNKKVRIKPLLFTRSLTRSSVTKTLNKATTEQLTKAISKTSFDDLLNDLISHRVQSHFWKSLKTVYPLRNFEIKSMELEKEKKPMEELENVKVVEEKKEAEPEKKEAGKKEETKEEESKKEEKVEEKEANKEKQPEEGEEKKEMPKAEEEKKEEEQPEVKEKQPEKKEVKEEK